MRCDTFLHAHIVQTKWKWKICSNFYYEKAHVRGSNLSQYVMIHFRGNEWNHLLSSQANTSYLIPLIHPLHTLSSSFDKLKRKASLYSKEYHWHMSFDIKLSWEIYCFTYSRIFEYFIMAIDQEGIYLTESGLRL